MTGGSELDRAPNKHVIITRHDAFSETSLGRIREEAANGHVKEKHYTYRRVVDFCDYPFGQTVSGNDKKPVTGTTGERVRATAQSRLINRSGFDYFDCFSSWWGED